MLVQARNVYFVSEKSKGICMDLWRFNHERIYFFFKYLHINEDK